MDYTAELHNVNISNYKDHITGIPFQVAWGEIYNDTADYGNHPIKNGASIHTSVIDHIAKKDDGEYIVTRNSVYKVVGEIKYDDNKVN